MRPPDWTSPDGTVQLYHGDCLELLPEFEAGSVDAVVTDPPFNSGRRAIANDSLSDDEWAQFCQCFASAVDAPNILVEIGKNDVAMRAALDSCHRFRWTICLNYTNGMRQGAVGFSNTGIVLWYGDGKCHRRYMDRIDAPLENTKGLFEHPSPKTTKHYERLVGMFSQPTGTILDPFMGSGTTGVACIKTGRKFIGIEIDKGYFETAKRRCEEAFAEQALFAEATA